MNKETYELLEKALVHVIGPHQESDEQYHTRIKLAYDIQQELKKGITYEIGSIDKDYIEEMGYYAESGDINRLASQMGDAYSEQDKSIEFDALVGYCGFTKHKKCHICGKTVRDGFHALIENNENDAYFCSDECLNKFYTEEEWKHLVKVDPENYYYSEWR